METLTLKQSKFINDLLSQLNRKPEKDLNTLTIKEASQFIKQLLKEVRSSKTEQPEQTNKNYLTFTLADYAALNEKFNIKILSNNGEGWTGSRHEEFTKLANGTKQRIYLTNIIKAALPGLNFKVSCNKDRYIRIEAEEATEEAKDFLQNLLNSVNWCNGDYYADYGAYYSYFDTLNVKKIIEPETLKAEKEEKKKKEFAEYEAKMEAERIENEKAKKLYDDQWAKDKMFLLNNVAVYEQEPRFFKNVFQPSLNKRNTFEEYTEQTDGCYRTVKVTKVINILDIKAVDILKNYLLEDIPELYGNDKNNGGSLLIWSDSLTPVDKSEVPENIQPYDHEALNAIGMEWATVAILVKYNGSNIMFIDTEGYSYARYVLYQDQPLKSGFDEFGYLPDETIKHTVDKTKVLTSEERKFIDDIKKDLCSAYSDNTMAIYNFKKKSEYSENLLNELNKICDYTIESGLCFSYRKKAAA